MNKPKIVCEHCRSELKTSSAKNESLEHVARRLDWIKVDGSTWYCSECCKHITDERE